jgi:spore germination protein GerM
MLTIIPSGTKLNSLIIKNGVATVDFNTKLTDGVAGSCKVGAIRAQIEETLKQFPTITDVTISVNGVSEGILQP